MSSADKLTYFPVRARGEPIRMLYSLAGKSLDEETITFQEWPKMKQDFHMGQLPVLTTDKGTLNQSAAIIRYAAKKLGLFGKDLWEEALHDMIIENVLESAGQAQRTYPWKLFKIVPEPENPDEILGKIGAADISLYCLLQFSRVAVPDSMPLTPWVKEFCEKFEADERVKTYLAARPEYDINV